jgi:hypothetical protein
MISPSTPIHSTMATSTHAPEVDGRDDEFDAIVEEIRDRLVAAMRQTRQVVDLHRIRPVIDAFLAPLDRVGIHLLEMALEAPASRDLHYIAQELLSIADEQEGSAPAEPPTLPAQPPAAVAPSSDATLAPVASTSIALPGTVERVEAELLAGSPERGV